MQERSMNERRKRTRAVTSQPAAIAGAGARRINCVVRNFSSTGARLEGVLPASLPETFDLVFDDERATLSCRIKWRRPGAVGVEFALPRR
jgi:PilZ domain